MENGSFGVPMRGMIYLFVHALRLGRTFLIHFEDTTYGNWLDWFLPLPGAVNWDKCNGQNNTIKSTWYINREPVPDATLKTTRPHLFDSYLNEQHRNNIPRKCMKKSSQYLMRFNPKTKLEIEKTLSRFTNWSTREYYAVHIRRGDKVFGPQSEMKIIPTINYVKTIEKHAGGSLTVPLFVASDSGDAIKQVKELRPEWEVWSLDNEEFAELRKWNYSTSEFVKKDYSFRMQWAKLVFCEMTMLRHATIFIGSGKSNFFSFVDYMRTKESYEVPEGQMEKRSTESLQSYQQDDFSFCD
eukprot:TRINITY_DN6921_c0_g1_i2.p1 TRINITY_DN6921_c0_g1~~TRINITY_DN6921_c0_g1_i2.p1  ORF type:complete len:298 (+),score=58.50 TRINITY_DN6921_c0_g1_i2:292-1185(+)